MTTCQGCEYWDIRDWEASAEPVNYCLFWRREIIREGCNEHSNPIQEEPQQ